MDTNHKAREAIDRHNGGYPFYALQREFTMWQDQDDTNRAAIAKALLHELIELECR